MVTAASTTPPVIMNRSVGPRSTSVSTFEIAPMSTMPRKAEYVPPRPPNGLVPPMTAAAIASIRTSPCPNCWLTDPSCAAARLRPSVARTAEHERGVTHPVDASAAFCGVG